MLRLNCFHSSLHNHTTHKSKDHVTWCKVLQSDRQFEVFGGCRHLKYGFSLDILWVADALAYCITSLDLRGYHLRGKSDLEDGTPYC